MRRDRWLAWTPVLLIAGLAVLTWWLDQTVQPPGPAREGNGSDPDFMVQDLAATRLNPDGTQRYSVIARKMVHYPHDNSTMLDQPRLIHFDPNKAPLSIRANKGVMSSNGENAYFTGEVQVIRKAHGEEKELGLYTSFLHVIPDQDLAKTDREVTVVSGNSTVRAVGLEFNNRTRSVKMLSKVRGQYETPQKGPLQLPWDKAR